MKSLVLVIALCFSSIASASTNWNRLEIDRSYRTLQDITLHLDEAAFKIPRSSDLKLIEVVNLSMIKVVLHKFKMKTCPSQNVVTDLELVTVAQDNNTKTTVGVNLAGSCVLEVFVEAKDVRSNSFLK